MPDPARSADLHDGDASLAAPPRRALVVEDDDPIRVLVARVLRGDGFAVDLATNGRVAFELIAARDYEVILLDLAMPEMNGIELVESLRERRPEMLPRIIVMTAAIRLLQKLPPGEVGAVISKPFALNQLRAAVAACGPPAGG